MCAPFYLFNALWTKALYQSIWKTNLAFHVLMKCKMPLWQSGMRAIKTLFFIPLLVLGKRLLLFCQFCMV